MSNPCGVGCAYPFSLHVFCGMFADNVFKCDTGDPVQFYGVIMNSDPNIQLARDFMALVGQFDV